MANETVELYYKGKPINPNRDLPTRTYAEAQAEGLTSSDKLWVRNDAPQSDLIVDNLTTDDSARALSAKQGKVLNDKVDGLIKKKTVSVTISSGQTNAVNTNIAYDRIISIILIKNDDIFYNPIIYSLQNYNDWGLIEARVVPAGTAVSTSRTYDFMVVYI